MVMNGSMKRVFLGQISKRHSRNRRPKEAEERKESSSIAVK